VYSSRTAPRDLIPSCGAFVMTQDDEYRFRLYDANSQEVLWVCHSRKEFALMGYCPMSKKIVGMIRSNRDGMDVFRDLAVWNLNTGNIILLSDESVHGLHISFSVSRAGTRLLAILSTTIMMWDLDSGRELIRCYARYTFGEPDACCFTTDDTKAIVVCKSLDEDNNKKCRLVVFDVGEPQSARSLSEDLKLPAKVGQIVSSFSSQMLAVASHTEIVLVDLRTETSVSLGATARSWYSICFGYDDMCIVALGFHDDGAHLSAYRINDGSTVFRVPMDFKSAYYSAVLKCSPSTHIFVSVRDADGRTTVRMLDGEGAVLQQSDVYNYIVADLYLSDPVAILL
jgi:WD40 repeat protein